MFDPTKPTADQLPALKALILKMVKDPNHVAWLETILDTRDILQFPEDVTLESIGEYAPLDWANGVKVRPAMLVWAWFYPSYFVKISEFSRPLKRVNAWENLNPWHFQISTKHKIPLVVMAKSRTVVHTLMAEKEAAYQRKKAARNPSLSKPPIGGDFDFID